MNFYKKATFVKSIIDLKDLENRKKEVIFIGKSNVGKSSLINALTNNSKLAFTSKKPGHTRLLNYFLIDDFILSILQGMVILKKRMSIIHFMEICLKNILKTINI